MPQQQMSIPDLRHFRLLEEFGRSRLREELEAGGKHKEVEHLWQLSCRQARVPVVPLKTVRAAWRQFVDAASGESDLAVASNIEPKYTSVAVLYKGRVAAAHTAATRHLLARLLLFHRRGFTTYADFFADLTELCQKADAQNVPGYDRRRP